MSDDICISCFLSSTITFPAIEKLQFCSAFRLSGVQGRAVDHLEVRGLVIASSSSAMSRAPNHRTANLFGKHGVEKCIRYFPEVGDLKLLAGGLDTLLCNLVLLVRMGYVSSWFAPECLRFE